MIMVRVVSMVPSHSSSSHSRPSDRCVLYHVMVVKVAALRMVGAGMATAAVKAMAPSHSSSSSSYSLLLLRQVRLILRTGDYLNSATNGRGGYDNSNNGGYGSQQQQPPQTDATLIRCR